MKRRKSATRRTTTVTGKGLQGPFTVHFPLMRGLDSPLDGKARVRLQAELDEVDAALRKAEVTSRDAFLA